MTDEHDTQHYPPLEETTNIVSHAIGLVASVVALIMMVVKASTGGNAWHIVGVAIFGFSLITLYAASTMYHSANNPKTRSRLRIVDHAMIYVLIAGTYTPFTLVTLNGWVGWTIFGISWGMAVIGLVLKIFHTGKYNVLSTLMYIFMGWMIVFAIQPMINSIEPRGLAWLIGGGIAYTTGAVLYAIKKIPFNHALFHLFVLLGSFCHFMAVYYYVLDW